MATYNISMISRQEDNCFKISSQSTVTLRTVAQPKLLISHVKVQHYLREGWIYISPLWQNIECLSLLHSLAQEEEFFKIPKPMDFSYRWAHCRLFPRPSLPPEVTVQRSPPEGWLLLKPYLKWPFLRTPCYRLKVCVPQEFINWNLIPMW